MTRDQLLYESWQMPDPYFPMKLERCYFLNEAGNMIFPNHWHEKIEFLFFTKGKAIIQCNSNRIHVKEGDLIVVNSNDLHQGQSLSDELEYYCIIVDTSLLQSKSNDACEIKYIIPITENSIIFKNKVCNDKNVQDAINSIIEEYNHKEPGFELAVKSFIYRLIVLLLRNYIDQIMTPREYNTRMRNLDRFNKILQYIENHYTENLSIDRLSRMTNVSRFYFCRLFKEVTGKTLSEYINSIRIDKAEKMLKDTGLNITEIAMLVGFDDTNYFSRVFKKLKNQPPSLVRKYKTHKLE